MLTRLRRYFGTVLLEKMDLDKDISRLIDHSQLEKIFGKKSGVVGQFDPKELFTWQDLDELLSSQRLSPPRLRLAQQNLPYEMLSSFISTSIGRRGVELPKVVPEQLTSALAEGATLVLDAVDEFKPELRRLVRGFARSFASVPQINLYACFGDDPGFGIHWDDHDVFIFQLDGQKHWRIFEPTRPSPCYRDVESPPELAEGKSAYFDFMLSAGELLYVPRGHWHDVLGVNERSLHLTLGITHPTASDILTWLADELKSFELVRRDLPLFSEDAQARFSRELSDLLSSKFSDQIVAEYMEFRRATLQTREEINLRLPIGRELEETSILEWISIGRLVENDDGTVTIVARGKKLTLAESVREIVQALHQQRFLSVSQLKASLPTNIAEKTIHSAILLLAKHGAISVK